MAQHVWSVLCQKAVVDRDTNSVSLFDVAESVQIEVAVDVQPDRPRFDLPLSLQLVTFWTREDVASPERSRAKVTLSSPQEALAGSNIFEIDLSSSANSRNIIKIPGITLTESGRYWFVVSQERGGSWEDEAKLPFDVKLNVVLEREQSPAV